MLSYRLLSILRPFPVLEEVNGLFSPISYNAGEQDQNKITLSFEQHQKLLFELLELQEKEKGEHIESKSTARQLDSIDNRVLER